MFNLFKKKEEDKAATGGIMPEINDAPEKEEKQMLDSGIEIFTMPERFRFAGKDVSKAKATGFLIIFGGLIFLAAVSVLAYYSFFKSAPVQNAEVGVKTTETMVQEKAKVQAPATSTESEVQKNKETAEEAYLRIKGEAAIASTSTSTAPYVSDIGEIIEESSGTSTILTAKTKDLARSGRIVMILSDGIWKITDENWVSLLSSGQPSIATSSEISTSTELKYKKAADSDSDGLSDKEEILLGADINSSDSDGDGYGDLSELLNFYNPAGKDLLSDNKNIKKYSNNDFDYSILYPSAWEMSMAGGNDSIVVKSSDDQFMQIISQPNANREQVDAWYKKQFNESDIDSTRIITSASWDGIMSKDGLIVYMTDKKQNFIYTLNYNPDSSGSLDYENIFKIVLKSFEIK